MSRVAVVEDNADNRLLVEALLEDRHELDQYEDGASALEGMTRRVPDVVLLDVSLPGMDGPETLREMRRSEALSAIPVVALTAHAMSGDRQRLLAQGFDGYVSKPVDEEDLEAALQQVLQG